ncbi:MAG: pentapeptide repeat-containing protein [Aulosira sp. DedQUE10]|nr:pentapeptide repeat-containing protein [Aulosira sp. DedQUE10]
MRLDIVARRIALFEKHFGKPHLYLAYHAAFPLALTPDLMYRLWVNFQQDIHGQSLNIAWVAVGDFLLSSLCEEVGYELYEMDISVRNQLLRQLKTDPKFGIQRINHLSDFLLEYVRQQILSDDPDTQNFAKTLQWTALAYTKPNEAARQIALTFRHLEMLSWRQNQPNHTELVRMASLVETFAEPLADAQLEPLVTYARGMARFAHGDLEGATAQIGTVAEAGKIQIAGVDIPIPDKIQENLEDASLPVGVDFRGQNLRGRSFKGQNLTRANFSYSDIRSVDFTNAILTGANFRHAQGGLQGFLVVGLVLCAFLLAALSGLLAGLVGWVLGWELNTGGTSLGIGIANLVAVVSVLTIAFRKKVNNKAGAIALSMMGTTAIAGFEFLNVYTVLPEVIRSSNLAVQAILLASGIGIAVALTVIGKRMQTRALPMTLIAAVTGVVVGITGILWFWFVKTPLAQTALATLAVNTVIASAGAIAMVIAGTWMWNGAAIGTAAGALALCSFWLINLLAPLDNNWMRAVLPAIATVGLSWAIVITLTLAISLVVAEVEHRIFARAWILGAFLFGTLILFFIVILGGLRIYPLFRVSEDLPMILVATIVTAVVTFVSQRSLNGDRKFTAVEKFVTIFATTGSTTFHGADLTNADFTQATLKSTDFRAANLTQTSWVHTKKLDHACTEGSYLVHPQVRELVTTRTAPNKIFDNLNLQGLDLHGVNLADASFIGTNLRGANLQNSDLSRAKLIRTLLDQADLTGACLTGAYLKNLEITSTTKLKNVTCKYIFTRLPSPDNPDPARQPEDQQRTFNAKEFADFVQELIDESKDSSPKPELH